MNAYYKKIDELCVKKGFTHRALAEEIGISEVTLSRYLTGQRSTTLTSFMAICRTLDIEPTKLYNIYLYARMELRVGKYRAKHEKEGANGR